ncbi:hypothetical protein Pcinc_021035 [Petrolisthes cinctipes]|uniref:Uncharacterized protein n=1 Tax=Petrolisthes cinctipes TaxID=88211 RepID=A0AAE1FI03_PETCI|nr:hypothetical protein Pcinc_021035 [Petrolisthes cinctipes]
MALCDNLSLPYLLYYCRSLQHLSTNTILHHNNSLHFTHHPDESYSYSPPLIPTPPPPPPTLLPLSLLQSTLHLTPPHLSLPPPQAHPPWGSRW